MGTWILKQGPPVRRAILLVAVAGVPLFFLRMVNDPINVPKFGLLVACVGAVAAIRIAEMAQGAPAPRMNPLVVPAAAIAVPLLVAWAASPYKGWALFGAYPRFLGLLPYLIVIAFGLLVADAFVGRAGNIAWALFWAGAVAGGYAVLQTLGFDLFEWAAQGTAASSTLGNSNFTGAFLGIVLPFVPVLWITDPARRTIVGLGGTLLVAGWVASLSAGGWAAGLAGLLVVAGFILSARWRRTRVVGVILAGAVGAGVVVAVLFTIFLPGRLPVPDSVARRGELWRAAAGMGAAFPTVGRGPHVYAIEGTQYRAPEDAVDEGLTIGDDPHSVPLNFFANAGLVGGLGFLFLIGWVGRKALDLEPDDLLPAAFAAGALAYFVQGLVSIDTISLRTALWTTLGGLVASMGAMDKSGEAKIGRPPGRRGRKTPPVQPLRNPLLVAAGAVLGLSFIWWAGAFVVADARARHAIQLFNEGRVGEAQFEYERVLNFRDDYHYRLDYATRLGGIATALATTPEDGAPPPPEQLAQARRSFAEARALFGFVEDFPQLNARLIFARNLHDWSEAADPALAEEVVAAYRDAIEIDPLNLQLRIEAANILLAQGERTEVLELLRPLERYLHLAEPELVAGYLDLVEASGG